MSSYELAQLRRWRRPTRGSSCCAKGPTQEAFTFRQAFPAPDAAQASTPFGFGDECPAT